MDPQFRSAAQDLLGFIAASPTPYHAVARSLELSEACGFRRLREEDAWDLAPGGAYCVTRNDSALAAFVIGEGPVESGYRIVGAHTDSPALRLKPQPVIERHGYLQFGVEVYGGPILGSWVDRDLGLAGRVLVAGPGDGVTITSRLLRVDRPLARVAELAVHLDREVNDKGVLLNKENQLPPVFGLSGEGFELTAWIAESLQVDPGAILGHDLMLYDLAPPVLAGVREEFVFASRLDNLASCHAALTALLETSGRKAGPTRAVVLYDNEEVGSNTRQGAAGPLLPDLLGRIEAARGGAQAGKEASYRARARSILVSADMAHAVHPNYPEKTEARHAPRLNGGPVIKHNANARYATDAATAAFFREICRKAETPCQAFVSRADMPCGSTIGPVLSTQLGIPTVDVGNPMLSMHSCREMSGSEDHLHMIRALGAFFSA